MATREVLTLQDGVPERIALVYAKAKIIESRIPSAPSQAMFSLVDNRVAFLPLIAADKIREAGIQARVLFEITKLGPHNFRVRNLEADNAAQRGYAAERDYTPELEASLTQAQSRRAAPSPEFAAPSQPAPVRQQENRQQSNGSAPAAPPQAPNPKTNAAAMCMMAAMCSAVDAVIETQAYATRKGIGLTFSEESVRAIGLSIYIDACRNGGAR